MKYIFVGLAVILKVSCCYAASPSEKLYIIDRFVWEGAIFLEDRSLITLRKLPGFKMEETITHPNKHNTFNEDEYMTLEYDGLKIYGIVKDNEFLQLIEVRVSKSKWLIRHKLNVGAPFSQVIKLLGKPSRTEGNMREFCGETECVQFFKKGNKVSEVRFIHYAD